MIGYLDLMQFRPEPENHKVLFELLPGSNQICFVLLLVPALMFTSFLIL